MAQARHAFHITTDVAIYCQLSTSCVSLPKNKTRYQTPFAYAVNILNTESNVKMDNAYFRPANESLLKIGFTNISTLTNVDSTNTTHIRTNTFSQEVFLHSTLRDIVLRHSFQQNVSFLWL